MSDETALRRATRKPNQEANMRTALLLIVLSLTCLRAPADQPQRGAAADPVPQAAQTAKGMFWVATNGNDANAGTSAAPFATLARAQEAVRAFLASGGKGKIVVNVRGGTYRLSEPLRFGPQDSATNAKVTYRAAPGETPVVTGAIPVSGWERVAGRVYKADLNALSPKPTRQLYVNGNRMSRARTPDYPASFRPLFELNSDGEWIAPGIQFLYNPVLNPTFPDPFTWQNQDRIEAVITTQWKMSICTLKSISASSGFTPGLITMQEPGWSNANSFRDPTAGYPNEWSFWQVTRFENAYEFLDEAGEWYFNETTKILYYIPAWGEDIATAQVEMPQLETLIEIAGTSGNPVRNLAFQGFTFTGAGWLLSQPSTQEREEKGYESFGYVADQSGFHLTGKYEPNYIGHVLNPTRTPGNITASHTSNLEFSGNVFEHLGAVALDLVTGCVQTTISRNTFRDISSAAIQVGGVSTNDARPTDPATICRKNLVCDNVILRAGRDYFDAAGIMIGFVQETEVTHNTIVDVPWSGIAIGWGWGLLDQVCFLGVVGAVENMWGTFSTPTVIANNKLTCNQISQFLGVGWDGGAIYSTGQQGPSMKEGTLIAGNVAYGKRLLAGGNTFYTDGGSRHMTLSGNASYDNPVGVSYFGPAPNPSDPLPYPAYYLLNGIPYGSDTGGCRTYGDILYKGNYLLSETFFNILPYTDDNGVSYPTGLEYSNNHLITGVQGVPKSILKKAGPKPSK